MNALERFEAAMNLKEPDRVPLAYLFLGAGHSILKELGVSMKDVYYDPQGIVTAQLKAREMFGHDNVMSPWGCITVEAEALGSKIEIQEMDYPKIVKHAVEELDDIDDLEVPDPFKDARMPIILESLKMLSDTVGKDTAVVGFMSSPFTILDGIRGMVDVGIDMLRNPDSLRKMLEIATDTCIIYGNAMADVGVNTILVKDGLAGADMMRREHCMDFDINYLKAVVTSLHTRGVRIIIGNVSSKPYLDMQAALNPDAICFASGDIAEVKKKYGGTVCIMGNVDQTKMPYACTKDVEAEAKSCMEKAMDKGGYILTTGCEIPLETPAENVRALHTAVERYGVY
jgi:uroporphyrinogen decarboxylase